MALMTNLRFRADATGERRCEDEKAPPSLLPGAFPERQARQWLLGIPRVLLAGNCCTSTNCKIRDGRTPRLEPRHPWPTVSFPAGSWFSWYLPFPR